MRQFCFLLVFIITSTVQGALAEDLVQMSYADGQCKLKFKEGREVAYVQVSSCLEGSAFIRKKGELTVDEERFKLARKIFIKDMLKDISNISWVPVNQDGDTIDGACLIRYADKFSYPTVLKDEALCFEVYNHLVSYLLKKGKKPKTEYLSHGLASCTVEVNHQWEILGGLPPELCQMEPERYWIMDGDKCVKATSKKNVKYMWVKPNIGVYTNGPKSKLTPSLHQFLYDFPLSKEDCLKEEQAPTLSHFYYLDRGHVIPNAQPRSGEEVGANCIGGASECSVKQNNDERQVVEKSPSSSKKNTKTTKTTKATKKTNNNSRAKKH